MKKHFNSTSSNVNNINNTLSPSDIRENTNYFARNHYSSKNYQEIKSTNTNNTNEGLSLHSNGSNNNITNLNNNANINTNNINKIPLFKKC